LGLRPPPLINFAFDFILIFVKAASIFVSETDPTKCPLYPQVEIFAVHWRMAAKGLKLA
jgi:hypothetical protein